MVDSGHETPDSNTCPSPPGRGALIVDPESPALIVAAGDDIVDVDTVERVTVRCQGIGAARPRRTVGTARRSIATATQIMCRMPTVGHLNCVNDRPGRGVSKLDRGCPISELSRCVRSVVLIVMGEV